MIYGVILNFRSELPHILKVKNQMFAIRTMGLDDHGLTRSI